MAQDQLPRMCDLMSPAVDALLGDLTGQAREKRMLYANNGRYGDILRGWRAQAELWRARLTKEVIASRRKLASGDDLTDLAKSEFFAELPNDPANAVGEAILRRSVTNTSAGPFIFTVGLVPDGTRIKRPGDPAGSPPSQDADYQTVGPVVAGATETQTNDLGGGNFQHIQDIQVRIAAASPGPQANTPTFITGPSPYKAASVQGKLFDTFTVQSLKAAGGTLGVVDDQIKALALAMSSGRFGPTRGAAIAGALTSSSVRRAVYSNDTIRGVGIVFIADESWASSFQLCATTKQALYDKPWIGWGCRIDVLPVMNRGIYVAPDVLLRTPQSAPDTDAITKAIQAALTAYFDERPDWWTWHISSIGATVAGADDRILACTAVSVHDSQGPVIAAIDSFGAVTGTPPAATIPSNATSVTHYSLLGQAVTPNYSTPG